MAKKFGAAVSILMVCPIGASGGQIEMRRYVLYPTMPSIFTQVSVSVSTLVQQTD
jgi:hypothetical protein